ncbi:LLM class flavin-dependent oxidoreductase [Streptomyces roseochromogenus]|uniref:Luciferase-like domain-containing protein n=1 Tax=Streptomyces roseochromogenus subsp. oscitans DS 12.976 TaxID=1352936 RepID=V6KQC2_STRRC|nr:LLM class flavin-dependent oxidoreductase [Streptomyces roseochromogenus]EST34213.1 hypothetical protein M878_11265 [Streptomyces roseochromogenus subsp. oscitans DS 12.976]
MSGRTRTSRGAEAPHVWAWLDPGRASLRELRAFAAAAERAAVDAVLIADHDDGTAGDALDPTAVLGALAPDTRSIGLVAAVPPGERQPYHVARAVASLDHITHGRVGWYASDGGADRRTEEFVRVVRGLWDSFDDDAFVYDRSSGRCFDAAKLRALNHRGEHFRVAGPLNIARPPQGHPVVVQDDGPLAGGTADVVLVGPVADLESARARYRAVKECAAVHGRDPEQVRVLVTIDVPSPGATVDSLELWFQRRAADGFLLRFPGTAGDALAGLTHAAEGLLPGLCRRGSLPDDTVPTDLRGRLGLPPLPLCG